MMEITQLPPADVATRLETEEGAVYLDVRSEQEFVQGHPAGAINVPIFHVDAATGQPLPNPRFMEVVGVAVPRDVPVYVGCASGQRSFQAASLMRGAGYAQVANVDGGFSGKRDPFGNLIEPGWVDCGLAVESGDGGERGYQSLLAACEEPSP